MYVCVHICMYNLHGGGGGGGGGGGSGGAGSAGAYIYRSRYFVPPRNLMASQPQLGRGSDSDGDSDSGLALCMVRKREGGR